MPKKHYFNTCPHCGAALDPGERCDCGEPSVQEYRLLIGKLLERMDVHMLRILYQRANMLFTGGRCDPIDAAQARSYFTREEKVS